MGQICQKMREVRSERLNLSFCFKSPLVIAAARPVGIIQCVNLVLVEEVGPSRDLICDV